LATECTFPDSGGSELEPSPAAGAVLLSKRLSLLLVMMLSLGLWLAIWLAVGSLASAGPQ
jgi:hypothetical protein